MISYLHIDLNAFIRNSVNRKWYRKFCNFGKMKISEDSLEFEGNFNVQKFNLIFFKGFFRLDIYFCFGGLLWNFDSKNHEFP